jgi:hypothetical protein
MTYPASTHSADLTSPATGAQTISPSDSTPLVDIRGLYVGTAGSVRVTTVDGDTVTFAGASGILPIQVIRVHSTGTDAGDIIGLK